MIRFVLFFSLLPFVGSAQSSTTWTQFRGPNTAGHSDATGIPTDFKPDDLSFKVKLPGSGSSSPVFWKDQLYLTSTEVDGKRYVLCFATETGKPIWKKEFAFSAYRHHKFNSFASSTPCTDADGVYVTWVKDGERRAIALDHDGELRWEKGIGQFFANHGSGDSPTVVDGTLVILNSCEEGDSMVAGLDTKTGDIKWKIERGIAKASYHTPTIYQPATGDVQIVVANMADGMAGIDPNAGNLLWEVNPEFHVRVVGSPIDIGGGSFFVTAGSGGGGKDSMLVTPGSAANDWEATIEKRLKKGLPYVPTPIVVDDHLYLWGDRGIVTCVNTEEWNTIYTERVGGNYYSSPIKIGDAIYNVSREGKMVAIAADPEFEILGETDLGEPCDATLATHQNRLYIRTYTHLMCLPGE